MIDVYMIGSCLLFRYISSILLFVPFKSLIILIFVALFGAHGLEPISALFAFGWRMIMVRRLLSSESHGHLGVPLGRIVVLIIRDIAL